MKKIHQRLGIEVESLTDVLKEQVNFDVNINIASNVYEDDITAMFDAVKNKVNRDSSDWRGKLEDIILNFWSSYEKKKEGSKYFQALGRVWCKGFHILHELPDVSILGMSSDQVEVPGGRSPDSELERRIFSL